MQVKLKTVILTQVYPDFLLVHSKKYQPLLTDYMKKNNVKISLSLLTWMSVLLIIKYIRMLVCVPDTTGLLLHLYQGLAGAVLQTEEGRKRTNSH